MTITWRDLFLLTLRSPGDAAQRILSRQLPRQIVYMALLACVSMDTVVTGFVYLGQPPTNTFLDIARQPFVYFVFMLGWVVMGAHLLAWAGRALGGEGTADEVLSLVVWLNFVMFGLELIGFVLVLLLPALVGLYTIAVALLSLWMLVHFVRAGHRLDSLGRAGMVLGLSFVGLVIVVAIVLAVLGINPEGVNLNV